MELDWNDLIPLDANRDANRDVACETIVQVYSEENFLNIWHGLPPILITSDIGDALFHAVLNEGLNSVILPNHIFVPEHVFDTIRQTPLITQDGMQGIVLGWNFYPVS